MMEVESHNSINTLTDFYKLQSRAALIKAIPFLVIIFFFVFGNLADHFKWQQFIIDVCGLTLTISIFYFLPRIILRIRLRKRINMDVPKRKLIIHEEGLEQINGDKTLLRNWNTIKSTSTNARYIYFTLIDKQNIVIAKKDFPTEIDALNFLGAVQSHISKANPTYFPGAKSIPKPNYKLGFLCLIPLIGGVAGLIFLLEGIFKYKDKLFAIIGLFGIIVTITVYGSLFLFSQSTTARRQMIPVAQIQMNSIVKEIEFYKTENGIYPDSLQQLQIKNVFVNMHDPILKDGDNSIFNYHRIGKKYTLFSSGLDQIPGTADDIYPSLKIDTSKVGLIIK